MYTVLKNRILWFDGTNQVEPSEIVNLFFYGCQPDNIISTKITDEINQFNLINEVPIKTEKTNNNKLDFSWNIPQKYLDLDLEEYIITQFENSSLPKTEEYMIRLDEEFKQVQKLNLINLFKTLIYIIDTLKDNNQLWGVGRGSSCASLILYLFKIHCVDPVKFNINMFEFYHT